MALILRSQAREPYAPTVRDPTRRSPSTGGTSPTGSTHLHSSWPSARSEWALDSKQPIDSPHSLVVPAGEVVLKLNAPSHSEADHEADALALWGGRRRSAAPRT